MAFGRGWGGALRNVGGGGRRGQHLSPGSAIPRLPWTTICLTWILQQGGGLKGPGNHRAPLPHQPSVSRTPGHFCISTETALFKFWGGRWPLLAPPCFPLANSRLLRFLRKILLAFPSGTYQTGFSSRSPQEALTSQFYSSLCNLASNFLSKARKTGSFLQ